MPTSQEIVTGIRERLGNPPHAIVNNPTIYEHLKDEIDKYLNLLNLSDENWLLKTLFLNVDSDREFYSITSVSDFGRPTTVETFDESDLDFRRRELLIIEYQDLDLFWSGYKQTYTGPYKHNSEVIAFYFDTNLNSWIARLAPPPSQPATYKIFYEPGRVAPPVLSEKPKLMEQFHHLLKVDTAMAVLDKLLMKGAIDMDMFDRVMANLQRSHNEYRDVFDRYIVQNHQEDAGPRRAFNSGRSNSQYYG